nr:hypothetical protein [Streptomyces sp. SID13726]
MWDPVRGDVVEGLDPSAERVGAVVAVAVADGGSVGVTLHDDSSVRAWSLADGRCRGQLAPPAGGGAQRVSLAAATVGERLVAVTGDWSGRVQLWDEAGRAALVGHAGPVWALASAVVDGRPLVVTGGDDRVVRVWDLVARRQVGSDLEFPSEVTAVAMASDGRLVVGFGDDIAVLAPRPPA